MGLLRPSFVPPPEIRALRDLTRTRLQLVRDRSREWQRLEKLLEGALVKLSSVVHSLAKAQSARAILEAIAAGERDPKALAALAHPNVKGGRAAVEEALGGMALGDHHPMLIRVHLDHITLLDRSAAEVEDEIEAALDAIPAAWGTDPGGETGPDAGRGPDPAVLPAAERLAEIPGVSPALARAIIAETGLDMTRFQTADHLVSWACLAPVARQSGPRSRKPKKGQGDAYLRGYCTQAANGAARTDTFLGERLRRLSRRLDGNRARCAVARSILVIVWHLLASPDDRFADLGPGWHQRKADTDRRTRSLMNQLRALHPDADVNITIVPELPPKTKTAPDQARSPKCHGPLNHARIWWLILTVTSLPPRRAPPPVWPVPGRVVHGRSKWREPSSRVSRCLRPSARMEKAGAGGAARN